MRSLPLLTVAWLLPLLGGLLLLPSVVGASQPPDPPDLRIGSLQLFPSDGASDVPPNAFVWSFIEHETCDFAGDAAFPSHGFSISLRGATEPLCVRDDDPGTWDDDACPWRDTLHGVDQELRGRRPPGMFLPETAYTVRAWWTNCAGVSHEATTSFTTGTQPDETAPEPPPLPADEDLVGVVPLVVPVQHDGAFLQTERAICGGDVSWRGEGLSIGQELELCAGGQQWCARTSEWIRLVSIDLAGNTSEPSPPAQTTLHAEGCSTPCRSTDCAQELAVGLLLLFLLPARRLRRSQ